MKTYALYKGDTLLHVGTIYQLAEAHGVSMETIQFYRTPAYKRRIEGRERRRRGVIEVIDLDD